jgi:ribonuclease HII
VIRAKHRYCVAYATVEEIDTLNIFWASMLAMRRAIQGLKIPMSDRRNAHVLVDGKFPVPGLRGFSQTVLIDGDDRAKPIAAASILAKVERDEVLVKLAQTYPQYGFAEHKAYATEFHREAIRKYGPCPEHRRGFAGVKEFCK